jgi:trimeric autotransporter adhesin
MNNMNYLKQRTPVFVVVILLLCFPIPASTQAVSPPPDGCYSNFTTAEGCDALSSLTTGSGNTALGWRSLFSDTDGSFNTGMGAGALIFNNSSSNTAVGAAALLLNTTGTENVAVGTDSLVFTADGSFNNAHGAFALLNNVDGDGNNAFGDAALNANIHAIGNTAIGDLALENNDSSGSGGANFNTAIGASALLANIDGGSNNACGYYALSANTAGSNNQAIGAFSLSSNTTGSSNIAIGSLSGMNVTTANNVICIGELVLGDNVDDGCYVGNIWGATGGEQPVYVNASGKLGAQVSSRRFKDEIRPMEKASEVIYELKPVSFRYKSQIEPSRPVGFGLIAEDVEKVNPDLVACDKEGKPYSVRYDQVNAMLLNEFLKEHRKLAEQEATITQLRAELRVTATRQQKQIEALTAGLQKVSAQLELDKSTLQTVVNDE